MNCIVVPIYKPFVDLSEEEIISLDQLSRVLGSHQIHLVGPETLDPRGYMDHLGKHSNKLSVIFFEDIFFDGIDGYNRLLISDKFYSSFRKFEYLLIYQPDCYVFKDELEYWCSQGFDYIGAQWTGTHPFENLPLTGVGNGGFSLRKVKSMISQLKKLRRLEVLSHYSDFNWKGILPRVPQIVKEFWNAKARVSAFEFNYHFQEDVFWCKAVPAYLQSFYARSWFIKILVRFYAREHFHIAPEDIALRFSFETDPREMFIRNNNELPFGCHAWKKYDRAFWDQFISHRIDATA